MSPVLKAKGKDGCEADTKSAFENRSTLALFRRADPSPAPRCPAKGSLPHSVRSAQQA